jgi:2-hydroxy-3-oxopropionate reductase
MGGAICRTLLRGGWRVVAWDIARSAVDAVMEAGAEAASDPAEMATRAHIIMTSVPDAQALRAVALGDHGLVRGECAARLLIDTSTISPADARNLAADLATHGVGFLDAPVSGGVRGAESGQLAVMVGGLPEHFDRARAVLSCIGKVVVHCGPVGAGQITKACNQLVVMTTHESVAEALVLAQASGLDPWRVREALLGGYAASPILEIQGPRMLSHDFVPGGKARYHLKDIATIAQLAREARITLPAFNVAARQIEGLIDAGGADLDNSAIITVVAPRPGAPRSGALPE